MVLDKADGEQSTPNMFADHMSVSTSTVERKVDGYPSDLDHTGRGGSPAQVDLQDDGLRKFENSVLEQLPELGASTLFAASWTLSAAISSGRP